MKSHDQLSVAGVVHDLNNVFQTLVGVALQSADPEVCAAILRSVERGRHIVAELQSGGEALIPFETILANAAAFVRDHSGKPVDLDSQVDAGIALSGWAWERVLINLFLNSVRAMPQGGKIQVTALLRPSEIEIAVADEGCGIAEELREHLFEPHVSGNGSTGLGLHIVNDVVREHGGTVHAANRERGAVFTIRVPRAIRVKSAAG